MRYKVGKQDMDSVELKCMLVSRGLKIAPEIYKKFGGRYRIYPNALTCNCMLLPDETIVMATDLSFHISTLASMFSWDNLKLFKYMSDMATDFRVELSGGDPVLTYGGDEVCRVGFLPGSDFFSQKTTSGTPFIGNAVIQGSEWVAFQCLWPCDYAVSGKPCQYCFSGGQFHALAKRKKPMPPIPSPLDVAEITRYAIENDGADSVQITGGSSFDQDSEALRIESYMDALGTHVGRDKIKGEILLYITPPANTGLIDRYFALGADRIACSLEVWDDALANEITPGKREYTTKKRHIDALSYIAEKYGPGKAFTNFIIGLEPIETLASGAGYLAERGIIPAASVWMPFGKPVRGSMKPPDADYYRAVKEIFGELYVKYGLKPAGGRGLNVCVEKDLWKLATGNTD